MLVYIFSEVGIKIQRILRDRWTKIYQLVMAIANLLDPYYLGKDLSSDGMKIVSEFIYQYYPHTANIIWEQLLQYKTQTGNFNIKLAWDTVGKVDPITWWKGNFDTIAPQ